jgi:hypothetical protein
MNNKAVRRIIGGVVLVLVVGLVAWFLWPSRLAKARELRNELTGPNARTMDPQERRQKWEQFRREQEQLSPAERKELWADVRQKRLEEMKRYSAMSPAEKTAYLDERINRMEQMRKQREAAQKAQGAPGGTGAANVSGAAPPGPPGGPRSQEERERLRKERLDDSTPEERAMRDQYFKDLQARRAQRGLPALSRPR